MINNRNEVFVMKKFKVGDRVRIRSWDDLASEFGLEEDGYISCNVGGFSKYMCHLCGREATICSMQNKDVELTDWSDASGDLYWCFTDDMLEPVNKKESKKIVITTDGKATTARILDGKRVVRSATARCAPEDEFDFQTGAKIAFDRLIESDLWKRFEKNEVCVAVTAFNVNEFLKECEKRGYKWCSGRCATEFIPSGIVDKTLFIVYGHGEDALSYWEYPFNELPEIHKVSEFLEVSESVTKPTYKVGEFVKIVDNRCHCFPVGTIVEIKKIRSKYLECFGLLRTESGKHIFGYQTILPDDVEKIK